MKKWILALICIIGWAGPAASMQFNSQREINLNQSQLIADDWYVAGEQVNVFGGVLLDACIAALRAQLWGMVGRDLNVLAVEADVRGQIGDDLRIIAGDMTLGPTVAGSSLLLGWKIQVLKNTILSGDCVMLGQEISVEGNLQGSVKINGETVLINAVIPGDLHVRARRVSVGPEARILGSMTVVSEHPAVLDANAYLRTPITWRMPAVKPSMTPAIMTWVNIGQWYGRITIYIGMLVFGILLLMLLPGPSRRYALTIRQRPWSSLGWGLLSLVGIPLVTFILVLTMIGIPLAIVLGLLYLALIFIARLGVGFLLGFMLLKPAPLERGRNLLSLFLGFTVLTGLGWIPIFGGLINGVAVLFGMGAIWLVKGFVEKSSLPLAVSPEVVAPVLEPVKPEPTPAAVLPVMQNPELPVNWQPSVPAFRQTPEPKVTKKNVKKTVIKKKSVLKKISKKVVPKTKKR